tara:strand:- start:177 stop:377 length:201 start_codon:yes stop_codon:yes gene_type:complete
VEVAAVLQDKVLVVAAVVVYCLIHLPLQLDLQTHLQLDQVEVLEVLEIILMDQMLLTLYGDLVYIL